MRRQKIEADLRLEFDEQLDAGGGLFVAGQFYSASNVLRGLNPKRHDEAFVDWLNPTRGIPEL